MYSTNDNSYYCLHTNRIAFIAVNKITVVHKVTHLLSTGFSTTVTIKLLIQAEGLRLMF